ncbi:ATP-dependent Clp protease adaptor [compost metagenome]
MTTTAPVREAPTTTPELTFRVEWLPPYRVIVHNNDHNSFDEVIAVLAAAVPGLGIEGAIALTYEIHLTGAAVVFRGDVEEAEQCARTIRSIGIKVTVEPDDC